MNSKDYRNIREAYLDVYEQEEVLDEISIGMKRRAADASVDKVKKAGERFRSSTSVDVQPYLMKKKDKAEAQHLRLAKAAESYDLYDIILSHLIDEGYADTQEAAERIMVNMSEDWRESIVEEVLDEAYVDYRKGKLPSGRTPQQSLNQGIDRNTKKPPSADAQDRNATAKQAKSVGKEMDAHTSFGGKIMKALTPGLGNRSGAAPRVVYGEPNTDRHQRARNRRGESSMKD